MPGRRRPRLTSASAFGFGAGWEWVESEGEVIRQLIVYLEDRRALYEAHQREIGDHVIESVLDIRKQLTATLQRLSDGSGAAYSIRAMRDACVWFLRVSPSGDGRYEWENQEKLVWALGQLRGVFAVYLAGLADHYRIPIHGPLADIVDSVQPVDDADVAK